MSTNPFGNLNTDGMEEVTDRLGGGFQARDSGAYDMKVKAMYAGVSEKGAKNVSVILEDEKGEYRETIYVTNRAGENWFLNKDDKTKKVPLPGFTAVDHLCKLATGQALADQEWEEKTIKLYDIDAKKELPKAVMMCVSMLGLPITVGLIKTLKNKGVEQPDGKYIDGPEERNEVNISKVFHTDTKMTVAELEANKTEAEFYEPWVKKNTGFVNDKRTIKDGQGGKVAGAPQASGAAGATAPKKSLFPAKS